MSEEIERSACNTICSHDGICTLEVNHAGKHNASGFCQWEPTQDDHIETDTEAMLWRPEGETR